MALNVAGYFAIIGALFVALIIFIVAADPLVQRIGTWLGPQLVEDYVTPLLGLVIVLRLFWLLYESVSGWAMTKVAFGFLVQIPSPSAWRSWWKNPNPFGLGAGFWRQMDAPLGESQTPKRKYIPARSAVDDRMWPNVKNPAARRGHRYATQTLRSYPEVCGNAGIISR